MGAGSPQILTLHPQIEGGGGGPVPLPWHVGCLGDLPPGLQRMLLDV